LVERDIALSNMNTTANDVQLKMGKASSDSAYASGVAESKSMYNAALGGAMGAGLSMLTAAGSLYKQHSNYTKGKEARETETQLGIAERRRNADAAAGGAPANAIPPADAGGAPAGGPNPNGVGGANLGVQHGDPAGQPPGANNQDAARQNLTNVQADAKQWQDIWSNIAMHYPGAISKIVESGGNMSAAKEKMNKAAAERDQTLEQTIKSMMEAQGRVIDSAMHGNTTATNNAIQTIQALIQANRAG
jgi:hypothetical protein